MPPHVNQSTNNKLIRKTLSTPITGTDVKLSYNYPYSYGNSEVFIAANHNNPDQIVISSNSIFSGKAVQTLFYTNDGGETWQKHYKLPVPFDSQFCDPSVSFDNLENFYIATLIPLNTYDSTKGINILKFNSDGNLQDTIKIIDIGADKEMITVYNNYLYCVYTDFRPLNKIKLFIYNLANHQTLVKEIANSQVQGGIVKADNNGNIYVAWFKYLEGSSGAIYIKRSTDNGNTFEPKHSFSLLALPSGPIPVLNNTRANSFPSMDIDRSSLHPGRIYIAYAENIGDINNIKIAVRLRYSDDEGKIWSEAKTISLTSLSQAWMPWLAVDPTTGKVAVVYQGFEDTYDETNVYIAYSSDGENFQSIRVNDESFRWQAIGGDYAGDYIGLAFHGGVIYPTWADPRTGYWQVYLSPHLIADLQGPTLACDISNYKYYFNAYGYNHITHTEWILNDNLSMVTSNDTSITIRNLALRNSGEVTARVLVPWGELGSYKKFSWFGPPARPYIFPYDDPLQIAPYSVKKLYAKQAYGYPDQYIWTVSGTGIRELNRNRDWIMIESLGSGDGTVTLKTHNQCGYSYTENKRIIVSSGGGGWLAAYPNPATSTVNVEIKDPSASQTTLLLYDSHNNLRAKKQIKSNKTQIDMSSLPAGNYILKAVTPQKASSINIIKF